MSDSKEQMEEIIKKLPSYNESMGRTFTSVIDSIASFRIANKDTNIISNYGKDYLTCLLNLYERLIAADVKMVRILYNLLEYDEEERNLSPVSVKELHYGWDYWSKYQYIITVDDNTLNKYPIPNKAYELLGEYKYNVIRLIADLYTNIALFEISYQLPKGHEIFDVAAKALYFIKLYISALECAFKDEKVERIIHEPVDDKHTATFIINGMTPYVVWTDVNTN